MILCVLPSAGVSHYHLLAPIPAQALFDETLCPATNKQTQAD